MRKEIKQLGAREIAIYRMVGLALAGRSPQDTPTAYSVEGWGNGPAKWETEYGAGRGLQAATGDGYGLGMFCGSSNGSGRGDGFCLLDTNIEMEVE